MKREVKEWLQEGEGARLELPPLPRRAWTIEIVSFAVIAAAVLAVVLR